MGNHDRSGTAGRNGVEPNLEARQYLSRVTQELVKKNVLSILDLGALEMMCALYGQIRNTSQAGLEVQAATLTQLRLYQTEFGLTPASRSRITGQREGRQNKFRERGAGR